MDKPKFVYIARNPCGCIVGISSDYGDGRTANTVADFIRKRLTINRHSFEEYREVLSKEPGFMNCPHADEQLSLI